MIPKHQREEIYKILKELEGVDDTCSWGISFERAQSTTNIKIKASKLLDVYFIK